MIVIQDLVDELEELRSTQQSQAVEIEQLRDEVNALKEVDYSELFGLPKEGGKK